MTRKPVQESQCILLWWAPKITWENPNIKKAFFKSMQSVLRKIICIKTLIYRPLFTCRCAYTTDPKSFQVPPLLSIRTIRNIWKNLSARNAEAANIWPVGLLRTMIDATTVITSTREIQFISYYYIIIQISK